VTNLITEEGLKKLIEEYDCLWKVERPKVVRCVADAADEGDRSENAEYIYGKRRLREIDSRLKRIGARIKVLKVAAPLPPHPSAVSFGCWVTYEEDSGAKRCYQLVGPEETDVATGRISIDSPVGKALLKKRVDDEVSVQRPDGEMTLCITGIFSTRPGV
jgi:transcription elongation factor GreB